VNPATGGKARAAWVSVGSNTLLVAAKLAAGAITGSIAIVTEAAHSAIDLVASIIALVSVRMADEPPDPEHPYGHERFENFAAVIEGMLIVVGAGIIVYEATRKLVHGTSIDHLGVGIGVIAASALVNACVATFLAKRSRELSSAALEGDAAHLGTDALTSVGVLVGLVLVHITGHGAFDPIAALCVAAAIVFAGLRILTRSGRALVDEAPPAEQLDQIEAIISRERSGWPQIVGYHKLRARRSGLRILVDFHLQFRAGTTLEEGHEVAHRLRDAIEAELSGSEVLIHVEPQGSYRQDPTSPLRSG
jgi:cation diffusion facilitator family transporter